MSSPHQFRITSGVLAFAPIAPGDEDHWQAPGGVDITDVTVGDFTGAGGIEVSCQVTSGTLTPSANTTDDTTAATFCQPEVTTTVVGVTSFTLDVTYLPDEDISGTSAYLYDHDTQLSYFYLGLNGDATNPATVGRCRIVASAFGGSPQVTRTVDVSLPVERRPDIWWQNGHVSYGGGGQPATGATAGTPGTWTPTGSTPPADAAAATSSGVVASPATAWTIGQWVQGSTSGTAGEMHWDGSGWVTGTAP